MTVAVDQLLNVWGPIAVIKYVHRIPYLIFVIRYADDVTFV